MSGGRSRRQLRVPDSVYLMADICMLGPLSLGGRRSPPMRLVWRVAQLVRAIALEHDGQRTNH